jgi:hypothetical protein
VRQKKSRSLDFARDDTLGVDFARDDKNLGRPAAIHRHFAESIPQILEFFNSSRQFRLTEGTAG